MEQRTSEETALLIGTLLLGSGYEKLLLELAAIEEKDFIDAEIAVKENETVLGPLSRFEKAAWALSNRIEEDFQLKLKELKQHVCPSCVACGDTNKDNAPCRDLKARLELVEPLRTAMWDSIRKRFDGDLSSIAIRNGFVAVKCPPKECKIGIEVIEVHSGKGGLSGLAAAVLGSMGSFRRE